MISIIIPVYKNKEEFLKNLDQNKRFFSGCEVIIVNDDPQSNIKKEVEKIYPKIVYIQNSKNLGFGQTVNEGVKKSHFPYIFLLNSDVLLLDKKFKDITYLFKKDPQLFAVSFLQKEKDNHLTGKNTIFWKKGMFFHQKAFNLNRGINAWAEGGAAIFDKEKFKILKGFDPLYQPFYWEDIDLSYRAWKMGWKINFSPRIKLIHHHGTTINKYFNTLKIKSINYRNQIIFILKNITDKKLLKEFILFLPYWIFYFLIKGESGFFLGFINAIIKIKAIWQKRKLNTKVFKKTDQEVLGLFEKYE